MGSNKKIRTKLKRALACFMTVLMVLTAVPLGGLVGVDLSKVFDISTVQASAADTEYTEGYYTYTVSNGEATITDCYTSISGDVVIPDTLGGYPVVSIGDWAFYNCDGITSVTIPDSVKNIGELAFSVCSAMKSLTIGRNVTSIGENAFDYCTGLTKINWNAENVDDLKYGGAFYNAGADGNGIDVVFGNNVKKIPDYAFFGLYNGDNISAKINSVTMGNNITSIGSNSFENCDNLTSITIPNSVTNIGEYAFAKCTDLTSVTIPDSVTTIYDGAFAYCPKLTSVAIPDGVTIISWCLFDGCSSLTDVTIPDGITSIEGNAFNGCSSLKSITIPEGITSIEQFTFQDCSSLTGITIPDSVTNIEENAFAGCTGLTSITIPEGVKSISGNAFADCKGLTKIIWNARNAEYHTFSGDRGVFHNAGIDTDGIDVIFGDRVKYIPSDAFYGRPCYDGEAAVSANLKSVTFGDSLTSIGEYAFYGCAGLTSITLPDSVTSIGSQAFYSCTALTRVNISDLASWCKISFDNNASNPLCYAEKLYINGNLATNIVIPYSVTSIGDWAFYGYKGLTSITIPDSVTSIGNSAFSGCTNLQYAESKGGLETVGDYVFKDCSNLAYLIVPNSVTTLGSYAINGCDDLKDVYYSGTEEEFNEISFGEGYADRTDITVHFNFNGCIHSSTTEYEQQDATCTEDGFTAGVYCEDCGEWISGHEVIAAHHSDEDDNGYCDSCGENICEHASISTVNAKEATCTEAGYTGDKVCDKCGEVIEAGTEFPAREHIDENNDGKCDVCGATVGDHQHVDADDDGICDVCGEDITRTVISSGNCGKRDEDGNFGDNVKWTLFEDGELVISGSGEMADFYWEHIEDNLFPDVPYASYTNDEYGNIVENSIKSVVIEDGVTTLGELALAHCTSLKSVEVAGSVKTIRKEAFSCSENLESVNIHNGVETLENDIFHNNMKITEISIPESVKNIDSRFIWDCRALENINVNENNSYYMSENGAVFNKDKTSLVRFPCASRITDYEIPYGVTSIEEEAFQCCHDLDSVIIPSGVTEIKCFTFVNCNGLKSISIPDTVTIIGEYAFACCQCLENVIIPDGVISIGDAAFSSCDSIKEINIPQSVAFIGISAFNDCDSLSKITINNPNCTLGDGSIPSYIAIYGYKYSTAYDYAQINGNEFVAIGESKELESISISSLPNKTSYKQGASFKQDGLAITVHFSDGTTTEKTNGFTVSGFDSENAGTCTLTVTYGNKTATFDVEITEHKEFVIHSGETITVEIEAGNITYVKFEPTVSGTYTFYSSSDDDTVGYLFDADKNEIMKDDDGGNGTNFSITYDLEAGKTYYFGAEYLGGDKDGSFDVKLYFNYDPDHIHSYPTTVTVPATCTTDGVKHYYCDCGDSYSEVIHALGHDFSVKICDEEHCKSEQTCISYGVYYYECSRCGAIAQDGDENSTFEDVESGYADHTPGEWVIDKDSDCTTGGSKHQVCSVCGETIKTEQIPVKEHQYVSVVTAPTCTTDGYTTHKCSTCGDEYIDSVVSKLGHSFTNYVSNGDATCTADGTKTAKCDRCDVTDTVADTGSAKGHTPGKWITDKDSTCTQVGEKHQICSVCGETIKTEQISVKEHQYNSVVTAPTCTAEGYTTHTCSVCGDTYTDTIVPALGHSFTNYVSNGDATCKADGTKTAKCDRCDVTGTVTDKGSKLPHIESEWIIDKTPDCVHTGSKHTICTVCGQIAKTSEIPANGHKIVEETIAPTCDQDGAVINFCTVCAAKETVKVIYATGHNDKDGDGICDNCDKDLTENCTCLCHKGGIAGFFYKIIRLFWKIFKINRKCVCGKIHY